MNSPFLVALKNIAILKMIMVGLAIAMLFIVCALWWSVNLTYRQIMQAIYPLTNIAQIVSEQKAYNLRFPYNRIKEFQDLNTVLMSYLKKFRFGIISCKRKIVNYRFKLIMTS